MAPWCLPGASQAVQVALSYLPGASQAVQLVLSCLPGASQAVQMALSYLPGASQAVQLVLSCLPGASQAVRLVLSNGFLAALGCLPGKQNQIWPWQITGVSWFCLGRLLESFGLALADYWSDPISLVQTPFLKDLVAQIPLLKQGARGLATRGRNPISDGRQILSKF